MQIYLALSYVEGPFLYVPFEKSVGVVFVDGHQLVYQTKTGAKTKEGRMIRWQKDQALYFSLLFPRFSSETPAPNFLDNVVNRFGSDLLQLPRAIHARLVKATAFHFRERFPSVE